MTLAAVAVALLAVAWAKRDDERILCVACLGLRRPDEPPCRCRLEAAERAR